MSKFSFPAPESLRIDVAWAARHREEAPWTHFVPSIAAASLWHIEAGEVRVESDGQQQIVRAGDWVWRPPSGARAMSVGMGGATWHTVGIVALNNGRNWFAPPHSLVFRPTAEARGLALLSLLIEGHKSTSRLETDGLARALMGWLWDVAGDAAWCPHFPVWLQNSLATFEAQPDVSVAQLAHEAHFSPAQFRRLWEKHLGVAPRETLLRRRLEIAQHFLESTELAVGEIAVQSGFAGTTQLARAFRASFGASPLEWKRARREQI